MGIGVGVLGLLCLATFAAAQDFHNCPDDCTCYDGLLITCRATNVLDLPSFTNYHEIHLTGIVSYKSFHCEDLRGINHVQRWFFEDFHDRVLCQKMAQCVRDDGATVVEECRETWEHTTRGRTRAPLTSTTRTRTRSADDWNQPKSNVGRILGALFLLILTVTGSGGGIYIYIKRRQNKKVETGRVRYRRGGRLQLNNDLFEEETAGSNDSRRDLIDLEIGGENDASQNRSAPARLLNSPARLGDGFSSIDLSSASNTVTSFNNPLFEMAELNGPLLFSAPRNSSTPRGRSIVTEATVHTTRTGGASGCMNGEETQHWQAPEASGSRRDRDSDAQEDDDETIRAASPVSKHTRSQKKDKKKKKEEEDND